MGRTGPVKFGTGLPAPLVPGKDVPSPRRDLPGTCRARESGTVFSGPGRPRTGPGRDGTAACRDAPVPGRDTWSPNGTQNRSNVSQNGTKIRAHITSDMGVRGAPYRGGPISLLHRLRTTSTWTELRLQVSNCFNIVGLEFMHFIKDSTAR